MADELTDEEKALLAEHRAKNRPKRRVTARRKADDGTEYSMDLEGDEADTAARKHFPGLFEPDPPPADPPKPGSGKYFGQK